MFADQSTTYVNIWACTDCTEVFSGTSVSHPLYTNLVNLALLQSCKQNDNWCFSNCKRDCGQAQEQGINIERCKGFGNDAGVKSAQQACETTMVGLLHAAGRIDQS